MGVGWNFCSNTKLWFVEIKYLPVIFKYYVDPCIHIAWPRCMNTFIYSYSCTYHVVHRHKYSSVLVHKCTMLLWYVCSCFILYFLPVNISVKRCDNVRIKWTFFCLSVLSTKTGFSCLCLKQVWFWSFWNKSYDLGIDVDKKQVEIMKFYHCVGFINKINFWSVFYKSMHSFFLYPDET